jgi:TP901 family phage tail tape measure protein
MANDGSVVFGTEVDESGLKKGLKNIAGLAGNGLAALGSVTGAALAATTTGLVALGKASIETTSQFDTSMSQIAATLGITSEDIANNVNGAGDTFDSLRAKALEMGSATNFTAQQAADGLNILAMSGYDAETSISMIEDVLHLAAAGSMDLSTAAGFVSGSMKGFADNTKSAQYYADLMAKGATLANTNVSQLGDALSGAAAVASSYGQSADSVTISLLRLAEQGVVGSAASTELAAAMKNLYAPTNQAADALKEVGVSAFDEKGNFRDFNTVVNELYGSLNTLGDDGLPKYTDAQKTAIAQTIFGIQGFNAYNQMVVTSTEKQEEWAAALADSTGEASKQYATMTDNLQGDLDILGSAFDGLKIAIGDELMPTMREFVQFGSDGLARLTEAFNVGGIEGAFSELGTILSEALVKLTGFLPKAIEIGGRLLSSILQGISDHAGEIMSAAVEVVTELVQAIIDNAPLVLETGIVLISELLNGIGAALPELIPAAVEAILTLVQTLVGNVGMLVNAAIQLVKGLASGIVKAIPIIVQALPKLIESILTAIVENLPVIIEAGVSILNALLDGIMEALPVLLGYLPTLIGSVVSVLVENLPLILDAGMQLLTSLLSGIMEALPELIGYIPTIVQTICTLVVDNLPLIIETGIQLLMQLLNGIIDALPELIGYIPTIIDSIVAAITELLPIIIETGIQLLISLVQGIINALPQLIASAPRLISSLVGGITQNLPQIIQSGVKLVIALVQGIIQNLPQILQAAVKLIGELVRGLISCIPQIIQSAVQMGGELVKNLFKTISDGFKSVVSIGKDLVSGIWNGISSSLSWIKNKIKSWVGDVVGFLKRLFGIGSPSKVMAREVGRWLPPGMSVGFENAMPDAEKALQDTVDDAVDSLQANMPSPQIELKAKTSGIDAEIGAAYDRMQSAIEAEQRKLQVSENVQLATRNAEAETEHEPEYVETVINIDGKETARVISPYVSKEIAWSTKK